MTAMTSTPRTISLPQLDPTALALPGVRREARMCVFSLTKTFPGQLQPVVDNVSFCVESGEVFVLVGPSGCGKTTTLRLLAGFEQADGGEVLCEGRMLTGGTTHLPPERRGIGFVFQDYALFPHLNVLRNVMFGIRHLPRRQRKAAALEALDMVRITGLETRMPQQLSGGQQQRIALARALATGSPVILLDEPFSSLDADLRHSTRREVRDLAQRAGVALVLVTHDQEEALSTADHLAVMRDGQLLRVGPPEEVYRRPLSSFVAQFLGRTNLLRVDAAGRSAASPLGHVTLDTRTEGSALVSIRPEDLRLERGVAGDPQIASREYKGHDITFTVRSVAGTVLVQTDASTPFGVGDAVRVVSAGPASVLIRD